MKQLEFITKKINTQSLHIEIYVHHSIEVSIRDRATDLSFGYEVEIGYILDAEDPKETKRKGEQIASNVIDYITLIAELKLEGVDKLDTRWLVVQAVEEYVKNIM